MRRKKRIKKKLLSVGKVMKLDISKTDLEVCSLFRSNDYCNFVVPFKGSLEGVNIFVEENYKIGSYSEKGELIDDSLRVGINPWPYDGMKKKNLKKMKKFLLRFAKKYPSAIMVWGDDGLVLEKVSKKFILSVMNDFC